MSVDERVPAISRSVGWTASGNLVFALSQWLIISITAKLAGATALGHFTLAAAVTAPVLALSQLQLRAVLATDARYEYRFGDYVRGRLWPTLGMLVLTPLAAAAWGMSGQPLAVLSAFILAKAFDSGSDVLFGYHQRRENMRVIAVGQFINGSASVALFGVVLAVTNSLPLATMGYACASALTLAAWAIPVSLRARRTDREDPGGQPRAVWSLIRIAAPLGAVMVLAGLAANVPRYAVQWTLGEYELGIFGGISYIVLVGTNFMSAVGQAASPRLAKLFASGQRAAFLRLLRTLILLAAGSAVVGTIASVLWGAPLLRWVYGPEFADRASILAFLAIAAVFAFPASILAVAATAVRRFKQQLPVFAVVLMLGAIGAWQLIPAYGLEGAAFVTGVMGLAQAVGCGTLVAMALRRE